ncbi:FtsQ-type POTRA domain-containing protein [candidate division WOR-3 bacterium]|nr:FtsQ-type POTRA domain-containing protein [candidate division WOR-3 bacterium]
MKMENPKKFKAVIFAFLTATLFSAGVAAGKLHFFRVESVIVRGNTELSSHEIFEIAGVSKGDCVFFVNLSEAELNLSKEIFAKKILVRKSGPNALEIEIIERYPSLDIGNGKGVDADGYILPIDSSKALLGAKTMNEYTESDLFLTEEDRILKDVASVCSQGINFPFLSEVIVCKKGLSVKTKDGVYAYFGYSDFVLSYRILMTVRGTDWWDRKYCYDLSSPGELLIFKRSALTNNKDCYGG